MNRRQLLGLSMLRSAKEGDPLKQAPIPIRIEPQMNAQLPTDITIASSGLSTYSGVWGTAQAAHLLRRCVFVFNWQQLQAIKSMNVVDAVDMLLNVGTTQPDPPVNNYNSANYTDPDIPLGQTWITGPIRDGASNGFRVNSYKAWFMGLMFQEQLNIREKMVWFWHNHLVTDTNTVLDARYIYKYNALLRKNIFGNFKQLIKDITIDPAMLRYLNGYANTKAAPDENYGRELMELFTLGKGTDSQYTESDVKAAARVLTGWTDNYLSIDSEFDPNRHDTGDKQFSSFFNNTKITGKTGANGAGETDELIEMIFKKEDVVARFMVRKLYRYFVYYVIDADVENTIITPLADIFKKNWEIKPVLEALLKSEHFFDSLNMGCYIKNPVDFFGSYIKQFNMKMPDKNIVVQYHFWEVLGVVSSILAMNPGDPPNVAGWQAYYQTPQFYELWINTDTITKRGQYADVFNYGGYTNMGETLKLDHVDFISSLPSPENPDALINDICTLLYPLDIDATRKNEIKVAALLFGQVSDHYWTDLWFNYKANPSDTTLESMVIARLRYLFYFLTNQAEYQLA